MRKNLLWIIAAFALTWSCPALLQAEDTVDYIAAGNLLVNKKQYAEAIEEYQKAVKMNPKNTQAVLLIGLCYVQSGDLDKALSYTQSAVKDDPSYTSYYNLGLVYATRKEFDKAIEAFNQALALSPKSLDAEYQKGMIYASFKKYDEAILSYQKILEQNPSLDKVRLALFGVFLNQGDRKAAKVQIEKFRKMKKMIIVRALEARMKEPPPVA